MKLYFGHVRHDAQQSYGEGCLVATVFADTHADALRYTRKVKRLFQTIDDSGDGAINFQEFSKLVQSPKLKFWMAQLEPGTHPDVLEGTLRMLARVRQTWKRRSRISVVVVDV